jgi:hypothetical protein
MDQYADAPDTFHFIMSAWFFAQVGSTQTMSLMKRDRLPTKRDRTVCFACSTVSQQGTVALDQCVRQSVASQQERFARRQIARHGVDEHRWPPTFCDDD